MRLPRFIARLNRHGINLVTRTFAGSLPPFALVVHRGRRTGHEYRTPIMAFPCGAGFVIALTYGRDTDWERNVRAGGGELIYRRQRYRLATPQHAGSDEAAHCLPTIVRSMLRLTRVNDFLAFPAEPMP